MNCLLPHAWIVICKHFHQHIHSVNEEIVPAPGDVFTRQRFLWRHLISKNAAWIWTSRVRAGAEWSQPLALDRMKIFQWTHILFASVTHRAWLTAPGSGVRNFVGRSNVLFWTARHISCMLYGSLLISFAECSGIRTLSPRTASNWVRRIVIMSCYALLCYAMSFQTVLWKRTKLKIRHPRSQIAVSVSSYECCWQIVVAAYQGPARPSCWHRFCDPRWPRYRHFQDQQARLHSHAR